MLGDMAIFAKAYDLLKYIYPVVNRFPKSEKFTLGQRVENSALAFLEQVIIANSEHDKSEALKKADIELEKLRIFVRLAHEYNFLGMKQYETISARIAELGKLLGGWNRKFSAQPWR